MMKQRMTAAEFQALPKKSKTKFDGQRNIRERLTRMNIPFEEEFRFALPRRYRADFLLTHHRILLEYQGGTYVKAGHSSGPGITRDCTKLNLAQVHGYTLLQFTVDMLRDGSYFEEMILGFVKQYEDTMVSRMILSAEKRRREQKSAKNWKDGKQR